MTNIYHLNICHHGYHIIKIYHFNIFYHVHVYHKLLSFSLLENLSAWLLSTTHFIIQIFVTMVTTCLFIIWITVTEVTTCSLVFLSRLIQIPINGNLLLSLAYIVFSTDGQTDRQMNGLLYVFPFWGKGRLGVLKHVYIPAYFMILI